MQTVPHTSGIAYRPRAGAYDESFDESGAVRPHYRDLLDALDDVDLDELVQGVAHDLRSRGATFGGEGGDSAFHVDPVPRLIEADEWRLVERGVAQRVRALNLFLEDVYGEQRIVA